MVKKEWTKYRLGVAAVIMACGLSTGCANRFSLPGNSSSQNSSQSDTSGGTTNQGSTSIPSHVLLYFPNGSSTAILQSSSIYKIDDVTGAPTLVTNNFGASVTASGTDPSGKYLATANADGSLGLYAFDPATGIPQKLTSVTGDISPVQAVIFDPSGKYLIVGGVDKNDANKTVIIESFALNQATGTLTEISPKIPVPGILISFCIRPAGDYFYALERYDQAISGVNSLIQPFSLNRTNGNIAPVAGSVTSAVTAYTSHGINIDHTGNYLILSSITSGMISTFSISATGGLTAASTTTASQDLMVGVSPEGSIFASIRFMGNLPYSLDTTSGALTALNGSLVPGKSFGPLAFEQGGRWAAANEDSNTIRLYQLSASGSLSSFSSFSITATPSYDIFVYLVRTPAVP